jgi:hypothetical protein
MHKNCCFLSCEIQNGQRNKKAKPFHDSQSFQLDKKQANFIDFSEYKNNFAASLQDPFGRRHFWDTQTISDVESFGN